MLPVHFGPCQTAYWRLWRFVRCLLFQIIHDIALVLDRKQASREASPSADVLDSQTVKAPNASKGSGYDAARRTKSRRRHIAAGVTGWLLMINLTTTDVQDAAGVEKIVAVSGLIGYSYAGDSRDLPTLRLEPCPSNEHLEWTYTKAP